MFSSGLVPDLITFYDESMEDEKFKEYYTKLNNRQRDAVDSIEGPVMVIAGPGTGKTQILALRVANILRRTDTQADSILVLTFTESGVYSIRKRLLEMIGSAAYKVHIHTFHSFSNTIIKEYPDEFPRVIGGNPISDIDQIRFVEEIFLAKNFSSIKPYGDPLYYVRPALSTIKALKREAIYVEDFKDIVGAQKKEFKNLPDLYHEKGAFKGKMKGEYADLEKKIAKNEELMIVYEEYEKRLKDAKLYDYEDMILEMVRTLEGKGSLLLELQEEYQYILADEHQDANQAQNKILELLSNFHENPNLFIVGDEKQAIFRFQGASLENFLYFKKLHPHAKIITLNTNYRSTQPILDAAHSLIEQNITQDKELRVRLLSQQKISEKEPHITFFPFTKSEYEIRFIAEDVMQKIKNGVQSSQIAVMYRDNKDAGPIVEALQRLQVEYVLKSDQDIMADYDISKFVRILHASNDIGRNDLLAELLQIDFFLLDPLDVYKAISYAAKHRVPLIDIVYNEAELEKVKISPESKTKFGQLGGTLKKIATISRNKDLVHALTEIAEVSGFITHLVSLPDSREKIMKLNVLFDEARKIMQNNKNVRVHDFLRHLDVIKNYNVLVKSKTESAEEGVRLMTAHKSKGLEFEYVYIVGAYDTHWGNKREVKLFHIPIRGLSAIGFDPNEDERRLFYVALTRAKKEVMITYAMYGDGGEERLPSQFVTEIKPEFIETVSTVSLEERFKANPEYKFFHAERHMSQGEDKEFLRSLFLEQGLSATAINKFLKCPWDYFFNNLLRLPTIETKQQMYGTSVHEALKEFFAHYAKGNDLTKEALLEVFQSYLNKKTLTGVEYEELLEKGTIALSGYYDTYYPHWSREIITEFAVLGIPLSVEFPDGKKEMIHLRGSIDKVERKDGNLHHVVDYKTSSPKSRNHILGNTKDSTGDYYRQLLLYKYLLENYKGKEYRVETGEIDFVEPDSNRKYRKEIIELTQEEVEKLLETIRDVARKIYSFSFWDEKCDEKKCEYCALRKMMRKESNK